MASKSNRPGAGKNNSINGPKKRENIPKMRDLLSKATEGQHSMFTQSI